MLAGNEQQALALGSSGSLIHPQSDYNIGNGVTTHPSHKATGDHQTEYYY